MSRPLALALAALSFALAALAAWNWVADRRERAPVDAFMRRYTMRERRPLDARTADVARAPDVAAYDVADAAVSDVVGTVRFDDGESATRELWLDAVTHFDDELRDARDLMFRAVAVRPGWAYHQAMLAKLTYLGERRHSSPALTEHAELWVEPLRTATAAAPGDDALAGFLAGAYLDTWGQVSTVRPEDAKAAIRRAFLDPGFVRNDWIAAAGALGPAEAAELLPDDSSSLRAALAAMATTPDVDTTATLYARWRKAEWSARVRDLAELEKLTKLHDWSTLAGRCAAWIRSHPPEDFDDPAGRAQVVRVLELWPAAVGGAWNRDPRGDAIRYFLDGRTGSIDPAVLGRVTANLHGVPDDMRARAAALTGDQWELARLVRMGEGAHVFEWTPVFIDAAQSALQSHEPEKARSALDSISAAARDECNVLLLRRRLAALPGAGGDRSDIDFLLQQSTSDYYGEGSWSNGMLSLCVDPARVAGRSLSVELDASAPALVRYGWDGGELGTALIHSSARIHIPLGHLSGRHILQLEPIAGGPVHPSAAIIE